MSSGIETIVQCLSKAVEATRGLNSNLSQNLCFVLNIANGEARPRCQVHAQGLHVAKDRQDRNGRKDAKTAKKADKPAAPRCPRSSSSSRPRSAARPARSTAPWLTNRIAGEPVAGCAVLGPCLKHRLSSYSQPEAGAARAEPAFLGRPAKDRPWASVFAEFSRKTGKPLLRTLLVQSPSASALSVCFIERFYGETASRLSGRTRSAAPVRQRRARANPR